MKISFKSKKDENNFKEFVCENKALLKQFLSFGMLMKNPIARFIFRALDEVLDIICP